MKSRGTLLSGIVGKAGTRPVLLGFASARVLSEISFPDVLDEHSGTGYQRPISAQHSLDFRRYIQKPGSTTIPLTFNVRPPEGRHWRISRAKTPGVARLQLDEGRFLAQVDCQHRLGHVSDLETILPFMIFLGLSAREEMEIFNVINSKARGLSSSLLDYHASRLAANLSEERPELFVALRLADDPRSPWYRALDLGGVATSGMKRRASLRTMQKAVRRFLQTTNALADSSPTAVADAVIDFWCAVRTVLAEPWEHPRKHLLTKGVGVYAMMGVMGDIWQDTPAVARTETTFASALTDFVTMVDWTTEGPLRGFGGESGVREALAALRRARAHSMKVGAHAR